MSTADIGAERRHRHSVCQTLHEIGTGGGGRAVILADSRPASSSADRAPAGSLYAGLHRTGASTLLEAALTWLDPRSYDAVLLVTGFGRHVPAIAVSDKHRSGEQALVWWLKGAPDALPPSPPVSLQDNDDEGLIGSAGSPAARSEGSPSGLRSDLTSRAWPDRMKAMLDVIDMELSNGGRRCLVLIDEAVLHPRLDGERAQHEPARGELERHDIERRFMALPRLVADSRRHDLVLLCRTAKHAEWASQGGLIREELIALAGDQTGHLAESLRVEAGRNARQFSELRWSDTRVLVMPAVDAAQPFGPWLAGASASRSLYEALRTTPLAPQKSPLELMDGFVGMRSVRTMLEHLMLDLRSIQEERRRGLRSGIKPLHVAIMGSPGTGKTQVARVIAAIYASLGLLPENKMKEVSPGDLIEQYIGGTEPKTRAVWESALGGVLFIDEAYGLLGEGRNNYGAEAVRELLKPMTERTSQLAVIFAGYEQQLTEFIRKSNPGLESRIETTIKIPDYTVDELIQIAGVIAGREGRTIEPAAGPIIAEFIALERQRMGRNFANGRSVGRLVREATTQLRKRLDDRLATATTEELRTLTADDFRHALQLWTERMAEA